MQYITEPMLRPRHIDGLVFLVDHHTYNRPTHQCAADHPRRQMVNPEIEQKKRQEKRQKKKQNYLSSTKFACRVAY